MIRVLVNMPSQYAGRPSGVAWMVFKLLECLLANKDFNYTLRSPWRHEDLPSFIRNKGISVIQTVRPKNMAIDTVRQSFLMPILCRKFNIDLILNVDVFGSPFGAKNRVMIAHDLYFKTLAHRTSLRERIATNLLWQTMILGNKKVICVSQSTRDEILKYYPAQESRLSVIHSASTLDANASFPSHEIEQLGRFILTVGNNTPNKNFGLLSEALSQVLRDDLAVKFVYVGRDNDGLFSTSLRDFVSENRVVLLENVSNNMLAMLYEAAECLCITSRSEGFCLPILEAQKYGCAVVAANTSAIPEVGGDGVLYFKSDDVADLKSKLETVLKEPSVRSDLIARGKQNEQRFSWSKAAAQYEAEFRKVLCVD